MEKRFGWWQLLGFGGVASALIAGLTLWLTYSREPKMIYERADISIPAAQGADNPLAVTFLELKFQNLGRRPAHILQLSISGSRPIAHYDWTPKLTGLDETRVQLPEDRQRLEFIADRFPAGIRVVLRVWMNGEGSFEEPRFTAEEFSGAQKVPSLEAALGPWYDKQPFSSLLFVSLAGLVGGLFGVFMHWLERRTGKKNNNIN